MRVTFYYAKVWHQYIGLHVTTIGLCNVCMAGMYGMESTPTIYNNRPTCDSACYSKFCRIDKVKPVSQTDPHSARSFVDIR